MAKVIPLFPGSVSSEEVETIHLKTEDIDGKWSSLLPFNPPIKPVVYERIFGFFRNVQELVEINSDGSSFLVAALLFKKRVEAICNTQLWRVFYEGLLQQPDLPTSVLALQGYSPKPVSLDGYSKQFRVFFSPQTFAELVSFREYISKLNKSVGTFFSYVVALILHGDGSSYLSAPTSNSYAVMWEEQDRLLLRLRTAPQYKEITSRILKKVSHLYTYRSEYFDVGRVYRVGENLRKYPVVIVNLVENPLSATPLQWLRCWWYGLSISYQTKYWMGFLDQIHLENSFKQLDALLLQNGYGCFILDKENLQRFISSPLLKSRDFEIIKIINFLAPKTAIGKSMSGVSPLSVVICKRTSAK